MSDDAPHSFRTSVPPHDDGDKHAQNGSRTKEPKFTTLAHHEKEKMGEDSQWVQHTSVHTRDETISFWKLFLDNWIYVMTYCTTFGSFGVCVGFLGPTVFDLGCQTHSDLKEMNWVFFVQLIMTLVGSISAGFLADKVPVHSLMLTGAVGVSLSMFVIPACGNLGTLIFVLIVMGWCMGCLDCLANLKIIQMFGKNVGPFLQAMHCSYGIGAFVSPMIASAFLLNKDCSPYIDGFTIETPSYRTLAVNDSNVEPSTVTLHIPPQPQRVFRYRHMSKLPKAFYILGGLQLCIAGLVAYVIFQEKLGKLRPRSVSGEHSGHSHMIAPKKGNGNGKLGGWFRECCACGPRDVITVTLLTCLSLFVFDGLQSSFANYIYTYAHESGVEGLKKYEGAVLDACFWGLFALGRFLAIPVASKLTASFMLVVNIIGCSGALLLTILFRFNHVIIYVGTCSVGLFVSSMSPTVMSMAEQYIDINPSITTCLVVVAALGEALCPVIVGNLVVNLGPGSFLVFCFTFSCSAIFLYAVLLVTGRQTEKFYASKPESFIWLTSKQLVVEGESTVIKPNSIKYYSRMSESDSNMEMGAMGSQDQLNQSRSDSN
ncbi:major facilitator superfamily domain-containing protein 4A [Aplysia californica]|uniref:Major facilitator superfamily domain-containing protein 4A n=1 Tax=Aplysia californica TaxID=6500 RepID=A0ABM1VUQ4_APLCA|nr:major facilitator superfamily domain-containing protein 4A [Aplysia californica]XP_012939050.1 major facilitator superfamily domain-containing protein 4A [Aplysia californica]XP_035826146.1 major facilitator superfamily domain-containing protein 4A [Aplysia californica]